MRHFVVPPEDFQGRTVHFSPAQARQMTRVLRLRDGDEVVALDGVGRQVVARLVVEGRQAWGEITSEPDAACREPARRVTLLVAPPKGDRWEWLLQKGTEIGVARFVPLVARYSQPGTAVVKPRHREIVREATEQCRRLLVPTIADPRPFGAALDAAAHAPNASTVLLWEGRPEEDLAAALGLVHARAGVGGDVHLVVGPEGGFHPDEVALARRLGVPLAGLGPLILRTETAALAAATLALNL